MKAARAFRILGFAWAAMVVLEIAYLGMTNVGSSSCILAIFLRGVLAGAAFGIARVISRGEANVPAKPLGIAYALVALAFAVLGIGLSVSPGSSLGFMAFGGDDTYDRTPNMFVPEIRQGMAKGGGAFQGLALVAIIALVVVSIVAAVKASAQRDE